MPSEKLQNYYNTEMLTRQEKTLADMVTFKEKYENIYRYSGTTISQDSYYIHCCGRIPEIKRKITELQKEIYGSQLNGSR